jgi:hypothetical protein
MGEVINLKSPAAEIENGASLGALVAEVEALLLLQQAALRNLRSPGIGDGSDSQIETLGNTTRLLRNTLRSLRAMLPPH